MYNLVQSSNSHHIIVWGFFGKCDTLENESVKSVKTQHLLQILMFLQLNYLAIKEYIFILNLLLTK